MTGWDNKPQTLSLHSFKMNLDMRGLKHLSPRHSKGPVEECDLLGGIVSKQAV